jgi:phage shock protein E
MVLQDVFNNNQTKFIDVRTPQEFNAGHFPDAQNIPLDVIPDHVDELKNLNAPIVLYCRSGARSGNAVMLLKDAGLEDVYNGGAFENLLLLTQKNLN